MSSFVSLGNEADLTLDDLLAYWAQDPDTDVVLLYLHSFAEAHRIALVTQELSLTKSVVVVNAVPTTSGRGSPSGVILADTLDELRGMKDFKHLKE